MDKKLDRPQEVEVAPPDAVLLAFTNAPSAEEAKTIAQTLVAERLAACVNMLSPCESVYRWQGAIEQATEVPMIIKTTRRRWPALQARLTELHPYEVPELIALSPAALLPNYAAWVIAETREPAARRRPSAVNPNER